MRNLGAILAAIGGGGQGFLRQRMADDQMAFQREQLASIDAAREAQAERDRAYAASLGDKARIEMEREEATRDWLRRQPGFEDLPDGVDVNTVMRDLLSRRSDATRRDTTEATIAGALQRAGIAQAGSDRRAAESRDAAMTRLMTSLANRREPRESPSSLRRQRDDFLYRALDSVGTNGNDALALIQSDPDLAMQFEELGLSARDMVPAASRWLSRRTKAAPSSARRTPPLMGARPTGAGPMR